VSCLPEAGGPDSLLVNPKDISDIKAKIQFLWDNEPERTRRAEKSFQFVQKFSEENIAKEMMKIYKEVLGVKFNFLGNSIYKCTYGN
jgi:glycosyltransferase involved in cell wall biosynthesis